MGRYGEGWGERGGDGEIWGGMGREGERGGERGREGERWGGMGRDGERWGERGRGGQRWAEVGGGGQRWAEVGRGGAEVGGGVRGRRWGARPLVDEHSPHAAALCSERRVDRLLELDQLARLFTAAGVKRRCSRRRAVSLSSISARARRPSSAVRTTQQLESTIRARSAFGEGGFGYRGGRGGLRYRGGRGGERLGGDAREMWGGLARYGEV